VIEDFYDLVLEEMKRRSEAQADAILGGGAVSFDSYREGVGFLRGVAVCREIIRDCYGRFETGEDGEV